MSVHKRGGRCHYAFCVRNVRYRKTIPEARTKYEAEQAEIIAKRDMYEGRYGKSSGEHDFCKFVKEVYLPWAKGAKKSWKNDEFRASTICQHKSFKGKTFAEISPLSIEKFKKDRRESTIKFKVQPERRRSPAPVDRELELLSRIFTLAIDAKVTESNPCRKVKKLAVNNKRTRYLLDDEEPLLVAQFVDGRAHLRPLLIVAIGTGMRRGDQLKLQWEKVDFQRNVIRVPNEKTGKDSPLPMNAEVREIMLQFRRSTGDSEYVFVNPKTGKPYTDLKKGFATACDKAKIHDLHRHDLRHTFGTRLAEAGHSEAPIAELMGHTDPKTTRRYTHGTELAKHSAVEFAHPWGGRSKTMEQTKSSGKVNPVEQARGFYGARAFQTAKLMKRHCKP